MHKQLIAFFLSIIMAISVIHVSGLRLTKTVNGVLTTHVWDGMNIIAELDADGNLTNRWIRGFGLLRDMHGVWFIHNGLGDVAALMNQAGQVLRRYRYSAFGVEFDQDPNDTNPWRYRGEYFDVETGMIYLRARFMNPRTGRFITADPYWGVHNVQRCVYSILQASNLFLYCGNDPVNRRDPSGLDFFIFHCPDFVNQAAWAVLQLQANFSGIPIHGFRVSYVGEFIDLWNSMMATSSTGTVTGVFVFAHGNDRAMWFSRETFTNQISIDGLNSRNESVRSISELNRIRMTSGFNVNVQLFSCNPGHFTSYSLTGVNFASALSSQVNASVMGFDGSVAFGRHRGGLWGGFLSFINSCFQPRISNSQGGFNAVINRHRNEGNLIGPYSRDPMGPLWFTGGRLR